MLHNSIPPSIQNSAVDFEGLGLAAKCLAHRLELGYISPEDASAELVAKAAIVTTPTPPPITITTPTDATIDSLMESGESTRGARRG